jgi:hypothetical protein
MLAALLRSRIAGALPRSTFVARRFVALPPIRHTEEDIDFTYRSSDRSANFSVEEGVSCASLCLHITCRFTVALIVSRIASPWSQKIDATELEHAADVYFLTDLVHGFGKTLEQFFLPQVHTFHPFSVALFLIFLLVSHVHIF